MLLLSQTQLLCRYHYASTMIVLALAILHGLLFSALWCTCRQRVYRNVNAILFLPPGECVSLCGAVFVWFVCFCRDRRSVQSLSARFCLLAANMPLASFFPLHFKTGLARPLALRRRWRGC